MLFICWAPELVGRCRVMGGVHASLNRVKTQSRAFFRPRQHSGSHRSNQTFNLNLKRNLVAFSTALHASSAWACPCMSPLMGAKRACSITLLSSPTPALPLQHCPFIRAPNVFSRPCMSMHEPSACGKALQISPPIKAPRRQIDGACWGRNPRGSGRAAWALHQMGPWP